ncbi:mitochondrial carrier domain-containing protein [Lipomyces oligophaga]|uniref:mitochondrial carrier domain-containing protein n=1 Tax=Lipomyces oligophaga TaxID=45792 RepID=UPI0034CD3B21
MDLATIAAAVAGAVGSRVAFHPFDTIRTLQQTSLVTGYRLPFAQYWRGLPAAVAFTTPAFTIYLVAYRQAKKELGPYLGGTDTVSNYVVSGAIAELASSVLWTPMEVVKGNMQLKSNSDGKAGGTLHMMRQMYQKQGLKGFFRGYWMGLVVFTPHSIVWWTCYEKLKIYLHNSNIVSSIDKGDSLTDLTSSQYAIASGISGIAAGTVSNFFDVLKTRQQLAVADEVSAIRPDDKLGLWKVARNLVSEEGLYRALFKGLHVRLMYSLPSGVLSMVIVEMLKPDQPASTLS